MVLLVGRRMKRGIFSSTGHDYAGLRIVQQIYEGESNNIVVKNGLRSLTRTPMISSSSSVIKSNLISDHSTSNNVDGDYFFLKSCHLCKNHLRPDKDVYMYRGDQGFCSIECRNRQIMLDETKEMKARIRNRVAISPLDCRGCETCKLLEELRQRPHQRTKQPRQPILSIS